MANITGNYTCEYGTPGTYTVVINGEFPQITTGSYTFPGSTSSGDSARKIISIKQWGSQKWRSMENAFVGAKNMTIADTAGVPDLSLVSNMRGMFADAESINQPLNAWNVSNVTNMSGMFMGARAFNQPLDQWDVSNVTDMSYILMMSAKFNQDISSWDIGNVADMSQALSYSLLDKKKYEKLLTEWSQLPLQSGVVLGAQGLMYCTESAAAARSSIISNFNWNIEGDMENCNVPLVTGTSVNVEEEKLVLTVDGTGFFANETDLMNGYEGALYVGKPLVNLNGDDIKWCTDGTGLTEESLSWEGITSGSDSAPCYYLIDSEFNPLVSTTQFRIILPLDFGEDTPGTISINGSPAYTFNAENLPDDTKTSQPLLQINPDIASVAAPLRTATLSVSDSGVFQGCASINTTQTHLLDPSSIATPSGTTPLGGVGFELECVATGGSALVSLRLGQEYDDTSALSAYKDLTGNGTLAQVDVTFVNRDGATYVEFPLTDGLTNTPTGLIDEDGEANGRIVDPLYIAVASGTSTPTQPGATIPDSRRALFREHHRSSAPLAQTAVPYLHPIQVYSASKPKLKNGSGLSRSSPLW